MFFCSFVFLCVTSSVSFTGFYTEDEPNVLMSQPRIRMCVIKKLEEDTNLSRLTLYVVPLKVA